MSTINYPNGMKPYPKEKNLDNHSKRGADLEKEINLSNAYYRDLDIALIYKKPTPVQVVRVDYESRNKAREFYSLQKHKPLFLKMSHIISISFSSGYLFAFFSPLS